MYRTSDKDIEEWINDGVNKHALLITGARQVGKTYSVRHTLKKNKCKYFEINFLTNPDLRLLIDNANGAKEIIQNIKLVIGNKKVDYIFFDEVQECLEIVTMIKFLVEEGTFRYILSGSLLGVEMNNLRSAPVGYLRIMTMYPMDLKEFYIALGTNEDVLKSIKLKSEIDDFIHKVLLKRFYLYLVVGGMPAVVKKYINTYDIVQARLEQNEIKKLYKIDFTKHEEKSKLNIINFYENIPTQLQQNNRFKLNQIPGMNNYAKTNDSFIWLNNAGVVIPTYNVTDLTPPLLINEKRNLFKIFLNDVGLLTSFLTDKETVEILTNPQSQHLGMIFENFAAQQLMYNSFSLRYYNSKKIGEIDFVVERDGKIVPIEIKSGKTIKKHQALTNAMTIINYNIDEAYVFGTCNYENVNNVHYCPIYTLPYFMEEKLDTFIYKVDEPAKIKDR